MAMFISSAGMSALQIIIYSADLVAWKLHKPVRVYSKHASNSTEPPPRMSLSTRLSIHGNTVKHLPRTSTARVAPLFQELYAVG